MAKEKGGNSIQDRNSTILNLLRMRRSMKISELQEILGVSDMTVRRCLNVMASDGLIRRVHGGAMAIEEGETRFVQLRNSLNLDIKDRLAVRAFDFIPDNGSVFLDSGTTCFSVAKRLAVSGKKCNVVTDSIRILRELQGVRHLSTMILGGALSDDMTTLDGVFTADSAERVSMNICLFSADGFNDEQLENKFLTGAMTKKILISRTDRSMCIADSSKYEQRCCFRFCGWEDVDMLLTDSGLPERGVKAIAGKGVEIHVVSI